MNKKQRSVLISVAVVIVVMLLFPPFKYENKVFLGHRFIVAAPDKRGVVDTSLLKAQWLAAGIVGAILYSVFADGSKE